MIQAYILNQINRENVCLISLYVDDLIITGGAYQLVADIKSNLSCEFEMKDLGDLHYCLGIDFWR